MGGVLVSHHEVQRVLVRMQYDLEFAARVTAKDPKALAGLSLGRDEIGWLQNIDVRALATDPLRRRRTLKVITEEYKVSSTLVLSKTRSLADLERFFESPPFIVSLYRSEPIVLAFGEYLANRIESEAIEVPQLDDVLTLERTMAECRRDRAGVGEGPLRLAPGVRTLALEGNVFETAQTVEKFLFEMTLVPQIMLATDGPRLPALPPVDPAHPVHVLLRAHGNQVELAYLDEDTFTLLQLVAHDPSDSPPSGEIVDNLIDEGVLALHD